METFQRGQLQFRLRTEAALGTCECSQLADHITENDKRMKTRDNISLFDTTPEELRLNIYIDNKMSKKQKYICKHMLTL